MRKRVFFQNAAVMTVTSLLLRSIGILFRIYVSNRVGAEGMGLYQLIVSVYVLVSSFAASGLTTAVTRLCTDELAYGSVRRSKRVLFTSIGISVGVGIVSGCLLLGCADFIAQTFLHDIRAVPSLRILTVSLPFMGASSCIKGYFLARRKVTSSSIAQILEQLVRIGVIVLILEITGTTGVEGACFAILLGDTIAEASSCLYMVGSYWLDKRHLKAICDTGKNDNGILKRILSIALPITGGRYLNSGLRTIENVMVPNTLFQFTGSRELSLEQFGKLKGMAMPLVFFPSSFLNAFTSLLIPEISEAKALSQTKRLQRTIERSLHMTLLSSYLISGVFLVLAYPLAELVYHDAEVGRMLLILAPLAPIMYLESVVAGILKGLNQQNHSLLYSVLDSVSRIVLILLIVPAYGIDGFFGVMIFSNLLTCFLNVGRLCKVSGVRIRIGKWIGRPMLALATAIAVSSVLKTAALIDPHETLLYSVTCATVICTVYLVLLPILGCVEREDLITVKQLKK